jgi:hypothetical protein
LSSFIPAEQLYLCFFCLFSLIKVLKSRHEVKKTYARGTVISCKKNSYLHEYWRYFNKNWYLSSFIPAEQLYLCFLSCLIWTKCWNYVMKLKKHMQNRNFKKINSLYYNILIINIFLFIKINDKLNYLLRKKDN